MVSVAVKARRETLYYVFVFISLYVSHIYLICDNMPVSPDNTNIVLIKFQLLKLVSLDCPKKQAIRRSMFTDHIDR